VSVRATTSDIHYCSGANGREKCRIRKLGCRSPSADKADAQFQKVTAVGDNCLSWRAEPSYSNELLSSFASRTVKPLTDDAQVLRGTAGRSHRERRLAVLFSEPTLIAEFERGRAPGSTFSPVFSVPAGHRQVLQKAGRLRMF
jgi:hypothetical protein